MKEFYKKVLEMKDIEPHNSKKISRVCQDIFRYLSSKKIKDLKKFQEKYGLEYENFIEELLLKHDKDIVRDIIDYDGFMDICHEQSKIYRK